MSSRRLEPNGQPPSSLAAGRGAPLEALEPRLLLSARLASPIADVAVDEDAPTTVINLKNHINDPGIPGTLVRFDTTLGDIHVALKDALTPKNVANFLRYVKELAYDDTFIHRSVADFVIQGGGYKTDFQHITQHAPVVNEFHDSNVYGTIAMAKLGGDPDSATSEWFFNMADNSADLDSQNGGFTVFGAVYDQAGLDVLEAIAAVPTYNGGGTFTNTPLINFTGGVPTRANFVMLDSIRVVSGVAYTAGSDDPALVTATVSGNKLNLAYGADLSGTAHVTVTGAGLRGEQVQTTFTVTVNAVNDAPRISNFAADLAPVAGAGKTINLSAQAADPETSVAGVSFYRESNGQRGLQTGEGGDELLNADDNGADGYSAGYLSAGKPQLFYARAADDTGLSGTVTLLWAKPDTAGGTTAAARNFGTLVNQRSYNETIGGGDAADCYKFKLAQAAKLTATLSKLSAGAELRLLNSSGKLVAKVGGASAASKTLKRSLTAGTYYISVNALNDALTTYTLSLKA